MLVVDDNGKIFDDRRKEEKKKIFSKNKEDEKNLGRRKTDKPKKK